MTKFIDLKYILSGLILAGALGAFLVFKDNIFEPKFPVVWYEYDNIRTDYVDNENNVLARAEIDTILIRNQTSLYLDAIDIVFTGEPNRFSFRGIRSFSISEEGSAFVVTVNDVQPDDKIWLVVEEFDYPSGNVRFVRYLGRNMEKETIDNHTIFGEMIVPAWLAILLKSLTAGSLFILIFLIGYAIDRSRSK